METSMISSEVAPEQRQNNRMKNHVEKQSLEALFAPESIAVIGATDRAGTVGRTVLQNLLNPAFHGRVYPVNPQRSEILGVKSYKRICDVPEPVDLVVLATPAVTIPGLIGECIDAK